MVREVFFIVPLIPPSVNHYVKHTRTGRHYVTAEAKTYKDAVAVIAKSKGKVFGERWEVSIGIFLGANQRRDVDNCGKVVLDALQSSGLIESDSRVDRLVIEKARDRQNPRTEITVRAR